MRKLFVVMWLLALLPVGLAWGQDSITPETAGYFTIVRYDWTSDASGDATGVTSEPVRGIVYLAVTTPGSGDDQPTDNYDIVVKERYNQAGFNIPGLTTVLLSDDVCDGALANRDNTSTERADIWPDVWKQVGGYLQIEVSGAGASNTGAVELHVYRTMAFKVYEIAEASGSGLPTGGTTTQMLQNNGSGVAKWISLSGDVSIADGGATTLEIDTEAAWESHLTDVTNVFTNNDTIPTTNLNSAVVLSAEIDSEAKLEALVGDVTDILTDNDEAYGYLINSAGTTAYVWTSQGSGRGQWAELPEYTGATGATAGVSGMVPDSTAGDDDRWFNVDGTFKQVPDMTGADTETAGESGLAPGPTAGALERYLRSDGSWSTPGAAAVDLDADNLNDVTITSAADADFLIYDATAGVWENHALSGDATSTNTGVITVDVDWTLDADTGTPETVANGDTLTLAGGEGIDTIVSATDTVTMHVDIAGASDVTTATNDNNYLMLCDVEIDGGPGYRVRKVTRGDFLSGISGSTTFTGLTDTPSAYTDQAGKYLKVNAGATALEFTDAPSGTAADTLWTFKPTEYEPPSSNYATLDTRNGHPVLDFDADTDESAVWSDVLPERYGGTGVTVEVVFAMTSATSGNVVWNAAFEDCSDLDLDGDSFATAKSATQAVNGTCGKIATASIAFTDGAQMDSLAAGDFGRLKITRDADNESDTAAGDAEVLAVHVKETGS